MKTLIVYETTHGSTEKCAMRLKELLDGTTELVSLKTNPEPEIEFYDALIIGGSIHGGQIQAGVSKFCASYKDQLQKKRLGLFICCMEEGEAALEQFNNAYHETLRKSAIAHGLFGGEFDYSKMNRTQKLVAEKVSGIRQSVSRIKNGQIVEFVNKFKTK